MVYFFINLILHLIVSVGLLLLLLFYSDKNKKRLNRRGWTFLLPVIVVLVFLWQTGAVTIPRVIDSVSVIKGNYLTATGVVESVEYLNHAAVIDGTSYYYNPFVYKPKVGDEITVSYTPYAHFAYELLPAKEL